MQWIWRGSWRRRRTLRKGDELEEEDVGDAGDGDMQAEQQAILDSLRSESAAEARRRRRQEMEAQEAAEGAKMFA